MGKERHDSIELEVTQGRMAQASRVRAFILDFFRLGFARRLRVGILVLVSQAATAAGLLVELISESRSSNLSPRPARQR
jgi:hypothetical protein